MVREWTHNFQSLTESLEDTMKLDMKGKTTHSCRFVWAPEKSLFVFNVSQSRVVEVGSRVEDVNIDNANGYSWRSPLLFIDVSTSMDNSKQFVFVIEYYLLMNIISLSIILLNEIDKDSHFVLITPYLIPDSILTKYFLVYWLVWQNVYENVIAPDQYYDKCPWWATIMASNVLPIIDGNLVSMIMLKPPKK